MTHVFKRVLTPWEGSAVAYLMAFVFFYGPTLYRGQLLYVKTSALGVFPKVRM